MTLRQPCRRVHRRIHVALAVFPHQHLRRQVDRQRRRLNHHRRAHLGIAKNDHAGGRHLQRMLLRRLLVIDDGEHRQALGQQCLLHPLDRIRHRIPAPDRQKPIHLDRSRRPALPGSLSRRRRCLIGRHHRSSRHRQAHNQTGQHRPVSPRLSHPSHRRSSERMAKNVPRQGRATVRPWSRNRSSTPNPLPVIPQSYGKAGQRRLPSARAPAAHRRHVESCPSPPASAAQICATTAPGEHDSSTDLFRPAPAP